MKNIVVEFPKRGAGSIDKLERPMRIALKQIPNLLTLIRIVLAGTFPLVPSEYQTLIILAALATEFFDGFIARALQWSSTAGRSLDPIADKLFFLSVCLTWLAIEKLSWMDLLFLGIRDIGVTIIVLYVFLSRRLKGAAPIKPRPLGKITTVLQYLTFFSVAWSNKPALILLSLTSLVGLFALVQYTILFLRQESDGVSSDAAEGVPDGFPQ